jgi:hypothetical protein
LQKPKVALPALVLLAARVVDFLPRIGRALLYPVYKGTYERNVDHPSPERSQPRRGEGVGRDIVISWSRDFSRSIDYLETRPDIDSQKLGVYNLSGHLVPVFTALDGRIKASVLVGNGFPSRRLPTSTIRSILRHARRCRRS